MRHEKAELVLRLATELRASSMGLSLDDMQQRLYDHFGMTYSRRTIERLRDAVERLHPELEVVNAGEYPKRWRLPSAVYGAALQPTQDELTSLDIAVKLLRRQRLQSEATELARLGAKIRSALPSSTARKYELDLQPLLEAEGVALRPGPHLAVPWTRVACIRQAIQLSKRLRLTYRKRDDKSKLSYMVEPYGLLYGGMRPYLIAFVPARRGMRFFSLAEIEQIDLVPETFVPDRAFSLAAYAERSFGVYQEKEGPFEVIWRFSAEASDDAAQFVFHPTQSGCWIDVEDGSRQFQVSFKASGLREMVWHLFTWGEHVEVLSPPALQQAYTDLVTTLQKQAERYRFK